MSMLHETLLIVNYFAVMRTYNKHPLITVLILTIIQSGQQMVV